MLTWGQLGRSPDILAPFITILCHAATRLSAVKHPHCDFGENIINYYQYCRDNDLFLTHALGDPQVDRSTQPQNEQRAVPEDEEIALHVVEETTEGVIVSGGKQLSTAAVFSNETYVSLSQTFFARNDPRFVLAFSIPTNSPGLKILAASPSAAGSVPGATLSWISTSRTACFSSTACWCHGTACSCSTNHPARLMALPSRRRHQLRRLGQPCRASVPLSPDHGRRHDGRRGDRRDRVPRGRRQAGRDGDQLQDVRLAMDGMRAPSCRRHGCPARAA